MDVNVGILAIGNEVVEGQITNRNAAWLAERLCELGATPLYHLSCRDRDQAISDALNFLSKHCQLIITSGGLGPTTDDFTRQSLSRWLDKPLELIDEEWECIKFKLSSRNLTIRPGHKNQALMPHSAVVLSNSKGVAPGFFCESPNGFLAALPGPPYELKAMFDEHLSTLIVEKLKPKSSRKLSTWICFGAPESEIANLGEKTIGETLEVGFRLQKPYVEVKVWLPETPSDIQRSCIKDMEKQLSPWMVSRSVAEIRQKFYKSIQNFKIIEVSDYLSHGLFLDRIKEGPKLETLHYKCFDLPQSRYFTEQEISAKYQEAPGTLSIKLFPATETSILVAFNQQIYHIEMPRSIPIRSHYGLLYAVESCFLQACSMLL